MIRIILKWLRQSTEIPVFLAYFTFFLCAPIEKHFVIYRTCYASLGYDRSECAKLGSENHSNETVELEKLVQPYANVILMSEYMLANFIPALTYLFVGAWSDRNGRKPIMLFALTGFILRGVVAIIVALGQSISAWYLLIGSVPAAFLGGLPQLMIAMVCYTIDVTDEENRGLRIGMIEAVPAIGMFLGTLCSSFIFSWGGYVSVYAIDILANVLSYLYVIFVLSEIPPNRAEENRTSIFSFENVWEMLRATFKARPERQRCILLLILGISSLCVFVGRADGTVFFQFLRGRFEWNLEHFTLFSSATNLLGFVAIALGVTFFHKFLRVPELELMTFGLLAYFSSAILQGLARSDWQIYLAGGLKSVYGIFNPMFRSFFSKLISKEETGKIFSLAVTVDAFMATLAGPVYTFLYNRTLNANPGLYNFVTAGVCGFNLGLIVIVAVLRKRRDVGLARLYEELEESGEI